MSIKPTAKAVLALLWAAGICLASTCAGNSETQLQEETQTDPVDVVLARLNKKTSELKSYEGQVEYTYIQPLLESKALRKGVLYYSRSGGQSALRINFNTLKQEDEKEQKFIEQYIVADGAVLSRGDHQFKGIWLVQIDYQVEQVTYHQLAEATDPNKPADVFDLVSRNFPMLGFTKIEELKKQFEVTLVEQKQPGPEDFIQVHLKVKPNSVYKDDYISIDFWIDKELGLPVKMIAVKTEPEPPFGDIDEIKFLKPKVNKGIDKKVFEFTVPSSFGRPEIIPKKKDTR
ncbi:MAG: hypothetical protein ABIF19_07985 [Planctomycetota bacterium]